MAVKDKINNNTEQINVINQKLNGINQFVRPLNELLSEYGNLETKTVTPTKSTIVVTTSTGYYALEKVTVNPIPSSYIVPNGTFNVTENGIYDVKLYNEVNVNVETSGGGSNVNMTFDTTTGTLYVME